MSKSFLERTYKPGRNNSEIITFRTSRSKNLKSISSVRKSENFNQSKAKNTSISSNFESFSTPKHGYDFKKVTQIDKSMLDSMKCMEY